MDHQVLRSSGWNLTLINVRVVGNKLLAGAAYAEGTLPEAIDLTTPKRTATFRVKVPQELRQCPTFKLQSDGRDRLEFELV
ncbi:hypothetical protein IFO70_10445 [Phormidium tenue FACHB-886]|nr:hypothetical protein [Phormidium tenue FACHB-886]